MVLPSETKFILKELQINFSILKDLFLFNIKSKQVNEKSEATL